MANRSDPVSQSISLSLSGSDPDGDTLAYSATGLPIGLTINGATGVISGTPSTAGSYTVSAQVSDGRGGTGTLRTGNGSGHT